MNLARFLPKLGLAMAALALVGASSAPSPGITVTQAWARPAASGMNGAAYLAIVNHGPSPDALVGASSPLAASVSLHESRAMGSMMTMRPLAFIPLPPGHRVVLAPGGAHLMLEGLKSPLRQGGTVWLRLVFRHAAAQRVKVVIAEGPPA